MYGTQSLLKTSVLFFRYKNGQAHTLASSGLQGGFVRLANVWGYEG